MLAWQTGYFVHFVKLMWWLPQIFCVASWATLLTADSVFDEDWAWHTQLRRYLWNYTLFIILYCCLGGFATGPMWQAETYVFLGHKSLLDTDRRNWNQHFLEWPFRRNIEGLKSTQPVMFT